MGVRRWLTELKARCSYIKSVDSEGETAPGSLIRTGLEELCEFTDSREAWAGSEPETDARIKPAAPLSTTLLHGRRPGAPAADQPDQAAGQPRPVQ